MPIERLQYTEEQMKNAEARIGFTHPVLSVIEEQLPAIGRFQEAYTQISDSTKQDRYAHAHLGFLADALVKKGPFSMTATDIVAIWSRIREVFSFFHSTSRLSEIVAYAYAVGELDDPKWKQFPRRFFQTSKFPQEVLSDTEGIANVKRKFREIQKSLDDIDLYAFGTTNPMVEGMIIYAKAQNGDAAAQAQYEELIARMGRRQTRVIDDIRDAFGNGFCFMVLNHTP
jgi:hypothetical protein